MSTSGVLPRSALLCAWGTAALRGEVSTARAVAAVQGDDEPHTAVLVDDPLLRECDDLPGLLDSLRAVGATGLRLVLPVPGDLSGLAGPAQVNAEAVDAGECVLTVGGPPLALVPLVEEFGSRWEPGNLVTWWVHDAGLPRDPTSTLSDLERQLREALLAATRELDALDLAESGLDRRGADLHDDLADVRYGTGPCGGLPPGRSARSLRVLDLAWRVRRIVDLARQDDGGAVSGWEASRRVRALHGLDHAARHAMVAAINAAPEGRPTVPEGQRRTAS
jgi:hypothetical protein